MKTYTKRKNDILFEQDSWLHTKNNKHYMKRHKEDTEHNKNLLTIIGLNIHNDEREGTRNRRTLDCL